MRKSGTDLVDEVMLMQRGIPTEESCTKEEWEKVPPSRSRAWAIRSAVERESDPLITPLFEGDPPPPVFI